MVLFALLTIPIQIMNQMLQNIKPELWKCTNYPQKTNTKISLNIKVVVLALRVFCIIRQALFCTYLIISEAINTKIFI
jgi:hypothetical protein